MPSALGSRARRLTSLRTKLEGIGQRKEQARGPRFITWRAITEGKRHADIGPQIVGQEKSYPTAGGCQRTAIADEIDAIAKQLSEAEERWAELQEELEALASGFPGIDQAYAIQAGRELRVIANAAQLSDSEAVKTCREIARAIEQQLDYPGEIKVTVIRESRATETAK